MSTPFTTHDVTNQSPPFTDIDLFTSDGVLRSVVEKACPAERVTEIAGFGRICGSAEALELGRLANENPPKLRTFDAKGRRLDAVEFHPAYHDLMAISMAAGLHCSAHAHVLRDPAKPRPGASVARAAGTYMAAQMESGHGCPITMTNAAIPTLQLQPDVTAPWLAKIMDRRYDKRFIPMAGKTAVTLGMGMTEKQGGTDVRANTTHAVPVATPGPGRDYIITGHKWFMSAPMCDAFLVLAQTAEGLSCFLLPRFLPDGSPNAIALQRLKDKLGNKSNASCEVEFQGAHATAIGEPGRGVPAIIEMVTSTRLDCAVASAGHMRLALAAAIHHARHRTVFQKKLVDQPLMTTVLADLALDVEAAARLSLHLAASFEGAAAGDERAAAWRRVMTPVTKYWVCKMAPALVYEAMECLGGNGYVEDGLLARLYREAPLNAIWEGSGNVMALDLVRVLQRDRESARLVIEGLQQMAGGDRRLMAEFGRVDAMLQDQASLEAGARGLIEAMARLAAAVLMLAEANLDTTDAFIATRLAGLARHTYGAGMSITHCRAIVDRALPG